MEIGLQEIIVGVLALTNGIALFLVRRFLERFDNLVTSVQKLAVCVATQGARWDALDKRLSEMRDDRIKDQDELWRAIDAMRGHK